MIEEQYHKRRLTGSYITSVVSISLVLLTLGLFGLVVVNAQKLSELIRENIGFEIILHEGVKEANILQLQKTLDAGDFVKSTRYITREEATRQLSNDLGEDFIHWLGEEENPLLPSIEVKFHADWANNDSLNIIEQRLLSNRDVKEVYYQKSLVHLINQNIRRIGIALLAFTILLLVIAVALINNTIRLSVYAKRFLVRSMQLVGATEGFIRKPFLLQAVIQGLIGSVMAVGLLAAMMYFALNTVPELLQLHDQFATIILFVTITVIGILLTACSTYFALNKYLRVRTDKLFV